jgi:hypothetical protein
MIGRQLERVVAVVKNLLGLIELYIARRTVGVNVCFCCVVLTRNALFESAAKGVAGKH